MKQPENSTGPGRKKYGFILAFAILLLVVATILIRPWEYSTGPKGTAEKLNPLPSGDSSSLLHVESPPPAHLQDSAAAAVPNAPERTIVNRKTLASTRAGRAMPPPRPTTLTGSVDSWEDWNSSFSDTVTRTYSVIFDSARLDTASGTRLVFAASGRSRDFVPVKQVFCAVDSVKPLVKYTFPGEYVNFGIGVGFASGVSFGGELQPRGRTFILRFVNTGDERFEDEGSMARNQFVVVLTSPPGYTYTLRTGIECYPDEDGSGRTRTYFSPPAKVEFPRMTRFQSLLKESGDSLFILTANPEAISDLAKGAPGSWISAVFVPVHDPSEPENLMKVEIPRLRIHVSPPRPLDKSFLILNDSLALVENNVIDPEFKRTAQLKLKGLQLNRIGLPRVTNLVRGEPAVEELKRIFNHFSRLSPQ